VLDTAQELILVGTIEAEGRFLAAYPTTAIGKRSTPRAG
jgi:hypothetical protein